jgi:hypothetical protein
MNEHKFSSVIISSWNLLCSFYNKAPQIEISDFVCFKDQSSAQVIIEENHQSDTLYLAVVFPDELKKNFESTGQLNPQTLSIVCEEVSHFFHLTSAAINESQISVLQLETLAEIDRFVSFLYWNTFHPEISLRPSVESCHQVCDLLFEQRKFVCEDKNLYQDAENIAFLHIQRAFSHCWTNQHFDARRFDSRARDYIANLFHAGHPILYTA